MSSHKEIVFENKVIEILKANGYKEGSSKAYDKTLALYPSDLIDYVKTTSAKSYEKLSKTHGAKVDEVLFRRVATQMDKLGSLAVLRKEVKERGAKFRLCQFKPELHNADTPKANLF